MTRAGYLFLFSSLTSSLLPSTNTGTAQRGWPLLATRAHKISYSYSLCHTHSCTHAAPFLLTYPELSRDRLTVTQCCPTTSDLPESSESADPWLTTEIQLPNQAGRQEGRRRVRLQAWAEREKLNWKFAILRLSFSLCDVLLSHLLYCFMFSAIDYIAYTTPLCYLFCNACSKGQDIKEKQVWQHGRVQSAQQRKLISFILLDTSY